MRHVDNAVMPTHEWEGLTIRDLTVADDGWQASFIEIDVPAGAVHPPARSTRCETFYYCQDGELRYGVAGSEFVVKAGDLVEIKPNEWYWYRNDTEKPVRLLSFNVPPFDPSAVEYKEA